MALVTLIQKLRASAFESQKQDHCHTCDNMEEQIIDIVVHQFIEFKPMLFKYSAL